jgi:hypothetical protein
MQVVAEVEGTPTTLLELLATLLVDEGQTQMRRMDYLPQQTKVVVGVVLPIS